MIQERELVKYTATRLSNTKNPNQGNFKKVLCVCSAGLLRSPSTAFVLSNPPFNFNTRACGMNPIYALVLLDEILIEWADEIVIMESSQLNTIKKLTNKPIVVLDLPDYFSFREPELLTLIKEKYIAKTGFIPKEDK